MTIITFLVLGIILQCGNSLIVLDCLDEFCQYNESVQYQCTVTDNNVLRWRIRNESMTSLDTESYTDGDDPDGFTPIDNAGLFSTALLSTSPLTSNISFTVQSSINGYNISCEDGNGLVKSCLIEIYDSFPSPPVNVIIATNIANKLEAQWTPPSFTSQCVTVSSYSITSNATNSIITTTDTSVDMPLAGLSPGVYCVSVATVDTANRTGEYSNEECVELAVSAAPIVTWSLDINNLNISWTFPQPIIPPLLSVYIYYTSSLDGQSQLIPLLPNVTNYTIPLITNTTYYYNISVYGENILGNGSIASILVSIIAPSTTGLIPSVSVTASSSPSGSSNVRVVVIVVPIVIAVIILVVVCIVSVVVCCYKKRKNRNINTFLNLVGNSLKNCIDCCRCCKICYIEAPDQVSETELNIGHTEDTEKIQPANTHVGVFVNGFWRVVGYFYPQSRSGETGGSTENKEDHVDDVSSNENENS